VVVVAAGSVSVSLSASAQTAIVRSVEHDAKTSCP